MSYCYMVDVQKGRRVVVIAMDGGVGVGVDIIYSPALFLQKSIRGMCGVSTVGRRTVLHTNRHAIHAVV